MSRVRTGMPAGICPERQSGDCCVHDPPCAFAPGAPRRWGGRRRLYLPPDPESVGNF